MSFHSVDVFPLSFDLSKYPLSGFAIDGENVTEIGATLAARVRKMRKTPCAWLRDEQRIVVTSKFTSSALDAVLAELQQMGQEGFELIHGVIEDPNWQISSNAITQFIVRGVFDEAKGTLKTRLEPFKVTVGFVEIQREALLKGLVVQGQPALQIGIKSPLKSQKSLADFYDPANLDSIKGKSVRCKDTTGIVDRVIGTLGDHRERLISYNPSDYDPEILKPGRLPDNTPIVRVKPPYSKRQYDYPISVLEVIIEFAGLKDLKLSPKESDSITGTTKISPDSRYKLISTVQLQLTRSHFKIRATHQRMMATRQNAL